MGYMQNYESAYGMAGSGDSGLSSATTGQSGGGFSLPQMQLAQIALKEKNREAADRWRLAQGINEAMNDSAWLMSHFPNFWGQSYVNPNAGAVDASLNQQSATFESAIKPMQEREKFDYEAKAQRDYETWKMEQQTKNLRDNMDLYQSLYNGGGGNIGRTSSGVGWKISG